MTNQFEFNGYSIRALEQDGELWFVARDVATVLGYKDPAVAVSKILTRNLEEFRDCQGVTKLGTPGGEQSVTILNEFGLYSFCMLANTDPAVEFRKFVRGIITNWRQAQTTGEVTTVLQPAPIVNCIEDAMILAIEQIKQLRFTQEAQEKELQKLRLVVNNVTLSPSEKARISQAVSDRMRWLARNGYHTNFQKLYRALYRKFHVSTYTEIASIRVEEAVSFIHNWRPEGQPLQRQTEIQIG